MPDIGASINIAAQLKNGDIDGAATAIATLGATAAITALGIPPPASVLAGAIVGKLGGALTHSFRGLFDGEAEYLKARWKIRRDIPIQFNILSKRLGLSDHFAKLGIKQGIRKPGEVPLYNAGDWIYTKFPPKSETAKLSTAVYWGRMNDIKAHGAIILSKIAAANYALQHGKKATGKDASLKEVVSHMATAKQSKHAPNINYYKVKGKDHFVVPKHALKGTLVIGKRRLVGTFQMVPVRHFTDKHGKPHLILPKGFNKAKSATGTLVHHDGSLSHGVYVKV